MKEVACSICGSCEWKTDLVVDDYVSLESFNLVQCQDCGFVFVNPRPDLAALARYYPPTFYGFGTRSKSLGTWFRKRRLDRYLSNTEPGRALDIGCGDGRDLLYLKAKGWLVIGTELSESSHRLAKSAGLEVYCDHLEALGFPDESFDVVMMWHVIEHLPDPRQTLQEVHRVLKPKGILLLGCPNYRSLEVWLAKESACLEVPRHLGHFTEPVLRRLLADVGFEVTAMHWFSLEIGVVNLLHSLLNVLPLTGSTPSFLHDWLGTGLYRERLGRAYPWHLLANAILMFPVACLSWLLVALTAPFGFSPTMELSAKKRIGGSK